MAGEDTPADPALDATVAAKAGFEAFASPVERKLVLGGIQAALFADAEAELGEPEPAASIGRFSILRRLGAGGMGVVYVGYDERLDRKAAIKLVRDARAGPEARERMLREARALARVTHPNVVQIYESGEHGGGVYIAMELVEGQTLRAWLDAEPRAPAELWPAFEGAGEALAAVHDAGLTHRDFKPDNVMIDGEGRVRVMDFGLVRGQGEGEPGGGGAELDEAFDARLTATGARVGTPAYMAPEQHRGEPADARSDQFSYCVVLWEALGGQRPFVGDTLASLTRNVLAGAITTVAARPELTAGLRQVLERGLDPDPEARWPSMAALLEALARVREGGRRRRRRRRGAILVAGLALLVGVGASVGFGLDARRERLAVEACAREAAALDELWTDATREAIGARFAESGAIAPEASWAIADHRLDDYARRWAELYEAGCSDAARGLADRPDFARVKACLGRRRAAFATLLSQWRRADAEIAGEAPTLAAALPDLEACADPRWLDRLHPPPADFDAEAVEAVERRLATLAVLLLDHDENGALDEARAALREAEAIGWDRQIARARLQLGIVHAAGGERSRARELLDEAADSDDPLTRLRAEIALVGVCTGLGQLDAAAFHGSRAEAGLEDLELRHSREEAELLTSLAELQVARGQLDRADELLVDAAWAYTQNRSTAGSMAVERRRAELLVERGEFERAFSALSTVLMTGASGYGPVHPELAEVQLLAGEIGLGRGKPGGVELALVLGRNYFAQALGPELAAHRFLEARWHWALERHGAAWQAAMEARELFAEAGPDYEAERVAVEAWLAAHPGAVAGR